MSTSFSTITPMNPATISKKPTYAVNSQPQPAASTPMDAPTVKNPLKRKATGS